MNERQADWMLEKLDRIIQLLEAQAPAPFVAPTCSHFNVEFTTGGMYCRDCGGTGPITQPTITTIGNRTDTKALETT